jgi:hypothetical protein
MNIFTIPVLSSGVSGCAFQIASNLSASRALNSGVTSSE